MWEPSLIIRNWRRYPFHWPYYVLLIVIAFYLVGTFSLFLLYKKEKRDQSETFYYKALDIRRRELIHLKLSGAEPFIWQPLFRCQELEYRKDQVKKDCIQTAFAFVKEESKAPAAAGETTAMDSAGFGYKAASDHSIVYYETPPEPCLICHPRQEGAQLQWTFTYTPLIVETRYVPIWESVDFLYFHLIFWGLIVLYLGFRYLARRSGDSDLLAVALRIENQENLLNDPALKPFFRAFFYLEVGNGYLRGYISRKRYHLSAKKFFTVGSELFQRESRAVVLSYGPHKVSFEGLRIAQAIANKAPAGAVVVQESLSDDLLEQENTKKAVWNNDGRKLHFRVRQLSE